MRGTKKNLGREKFMDLVSESGQIRQDVQGGLRICHFRKDKCHKCCQIGS
jgi:hypothetical protein